MLRVLLFTALAVQTVLAHCGRWSQFGHQCILVNPRPVAWDEAEEYCKAAGGHIAVVDSHEKHDFIVNLAKAKRIRSAWIGGHKDKYWKWVPTGDEIKGYTNWAKRKPDYYLGTENCLSILYWLKYQWDNAECNLHYGFVCEKRNSK